MKSPLCGHEKSLVWARVKFVSKFHENLTLMGEVNLILGSRRQQNKN